MKRAIISIAFCTLSVTSLACGSSDGDEHEFSFGATEMETAAGGDWTGALQLTGSADTTYQLHLEHEAAHNHPACESRTLNDPLCVASSSMGFVGTLSSADKKFDQTPVHANFMIHGETMTHGEMAITAGTTLLNALFAEGAFTGGTASDNGTPSGTFTMQRP